MTRATPEKIASNIELNRERATDLAINPFIVMTSPIG
jgi:hypothetical protein